jgi:hypothetical protein
VRTAALICGIFWLAGSASVRAQQARAEFTDLSGAVQRPLEVDEKTAAVLIFYWHDCPICNSYVPEMNRLCSHFTNFAFYTVEIDPEWTMAEARIHTKEFGLRAPFLLDSRHRLVGVARATVTPEAVVFGKNQKVLYRGRIDNAYASLNQRRGAATEHDLCRALEAIAAGRTVTNTPPPVGCLIPETTFRK